MNILIFTLDPSDSTIAEELLSDLRAECFFISSSVELITALESDEYDVFLILCDSEYTFSSEEILRISEFVEKGHFLIVSGDICITNPDLADLIGVEQWTMTPYATEMILDSDYYLVKQYKNSSPQIQDPHLLFKNSATSLVLGKYNQWQPPFLIINKTVNKNQVGINGEISVNLKLKNFGWSSAYNIQVDEYLNGFELLYTNYSNALIDNQVLWCIPELEMNNEITIFYQAKAPMVDYKQIFNLFSNISYEDFSSFEYTYPAIELFKYFNMTVGNPSVDIEVTVAQVLAWFDDPSDEFLIENVLEDICDVTKVNNIEELMQNLNSGIFDILWLMNFGWIDFPTNLTWDSFCEWQNEMHEIYANFSSEDAIQIKEWVRNGGKIISSDWALNNFWKSLQELYGIWFLGAMPPIFFDTSKEWQCDHFSEDREYDWGTAGDYWWNEKIIDWDWYHKIKFSEMHPITENYINISLKSKAWAFDVNYYPDWLLPYIDAGVPQSLGEFVHPDQFQFHLLCDLFNQQSPFLTISTFQDGIGIYFAADIGRSAYMGCNTSAWINICKKSVMWLCSQGASPIIAQNLEFTIPSEVMSPEWVEYYLNNGSPSISINSYGKGRTLFFSFDLKKTSIIESNKAIWTGIIQKACFNMIWFEDYNKKEINFSSQEITYEFIAADEIVITIEAQGVNSHEGVLFLNNELIGYLTFALTTKITLNISSGIHYFTIKLNSSSNIHDGFLIESFTVQKLILFNQHMNQDLIQNPRITFRASGIIALIVNITGVNSTVYFDNRFLGNLKVEELNLFFLDMKEEYKSSSQHILMVNGTSGQLKSIIITTEVDPDSDGLQTSYEVLYGGRFFIEDPWVRWDKLSPMLKLTKSWSTNFCHSAYIILNIPSYFDQTSLEIQVNSISGVVTKIKLDEIDCNLEITHKGTYTIDERINWGMHDLTFDYIESNVALDYNISFLMGDPIVPLDVSMVELDSDGDYLTDSYEITYGLNPYSPDSDQDKAMDSSDYSSQDSDIIDAGKCATYNVPILFNSSTTKITIQIQKFNATFDKTAVNLNYINGTVDILPMIRVFSKVPYTSRSGIIYAGDYFPNATAFANEYFAAMPLAEYKAYSWITELLYAPYHPAYTDNISLTFDFIWVAIQNDTNGNMKVLHVWDISHQAIIQGLFKSEIRPNITLILAIVNNTLEAPLLFEYVHALDPEYFNGTLISNIFILTNLTFFNFREFFQLFIINLKDYLGVQVIDNIPVIGSTIAVITGQQNLLGVIRAVHSVFNCPELGIKDLVINTLTHEIKGKSTWGAYLLDNGFSDSKFKFKMEVAPGRYVDFNPQRFEIIEFNVKDDLFEVKLKVHKTFEDCKFVGFKNGEPFFEGRGSWYVRIGDEEAHKFQKWSYSGTIDEAGNFRLRLRVFDMDDPNFSFREMGRRVAIDDAIDLRHGWRYNAESGLSIRIFNNELQSLSRFKRVLNGIFELIGFAMDIISIPLDILAIMESIALLGTVGTSIIGVLIIVASIIDLALAILGITAFIITILFAAGLLAIEGIAATIVSVSSAAGPFGLLVAFAVVLILIVLYFWVKPLSFDYLNFGIDLPTTDWNYQLSPEQGDILRITYTLRNTGENPLYWYRSRLAFGDNSYGIPSYVQYPFHIENPDPENPFPVEIPGFGYNSTVDLTINDTIETWGTSIDAILFAEFDFWQDLIWPPQLHYTPLDLAIPVYPTAIQEFIDACKDNSISNRSKDAVVVWYGGNGGMWGTGVHTQTRLYDGNYRAFVLDDPPDYLNDNGTILDDELGSCWQVGFIPENKQIKGIGIWDGQGFLTTCEWWNLDYLVIYRNSLKIEWGKSDILRTEFIDSFGDPQTLNWTFSTIKFGDQWITEPRIDWCYFYVNSQITLEFAHDIGGVLWPSRDFINYNN